MRGSGKDLQQMWWNRDEVQGVTGAVATVLSSRKHAHVTAIAGGLRQRYLSTLAIALYGRRSIMLEIITKLHLLGKHKGINMLREPTPGFMLDVIERLRQEGHPQTNLEINIQWLVTEKSAL